jgi:protein ImuB
LRVLATPEPVRVRLGRTGLLAFRHADIWHDVAAWCGPERLAPRWWRQDDAGPRDYFTTRERTGALWLLFRCARRRAWFAEGWWD